MTDDEFEKYKQLFFAEDVDQGKGYLVSYDNELLTCLLGTPTENFHLPFEEYREKMNRKYGEDEFNLVAIEE